MPVIANGTTSYSEASKRSYIATGVFTTYFYSYTSSRNANNQLVYTLAQNATDAQCKAGHILKENGRKLVYGVNNIDTNTTTTLTTSGNRPYYLVGVFDSSSMLSGFIDPNSPLFAPYSTDLPNFYDRSSTNVTAPDGSTNDMGAPVFTSGNITTSGVLYQVRSLLTIAAGATSTQLTTSGTTTNCIGTIITQTPGATSTFNLPTAAAISTALGGVVGMSFEFVISNLSGANTIILAVASGDGANTTIAGSATVAVSTNVRYIVRLASATTVVVYRA